MTQPCAGINAQQAAALHEGAVAGIWQSLERIDDGGEGTIGRRNDGIWQQLRHEYDVRTRPQHDVARIATIEAAAVTRGGVAVFEKILALLGQMPSSAGCAVAATIGE